MELISCSCMILSKALNFSKLVIFYHMRGINTWWRALNMTTWRETMGYIVGRPQMWILLLLSGKSLLTAGQWKTWHVTLCFWPLILWFWFSDCFFFRARNFIFVFCLLFERHDFDSCLFSLISKQLEGLKSLTVGS